MKKFKSLSGSGVLVVILSAVVFSIYVVSNFAEQEHYGIMQKKYEENIKEEYERDTQDIEAFYNKVLNDI